MLVRLLLTEQQANAITEMFEKGEVSSSRRKEISESILRALKDAKLEAQGRYYEKELERKVWKGEMKEKTDENK